MYYRIFFSTEFVPFCLNKLNFLIILHFGLQVRPWPKDYIISNPLEPPPIAQEIDIHVIDLVTLKQVGNMLRSHKAYTPNTECFFIFLDVCDNYVAR